MHAYNCTKNNATDCSPYYLMYGQKPRLAIDIRFGLASTQAEECSHNKFLAKHNAQLRWCYELVNLQQCKTSTHHKQWYDKKMRASMPELGDHCLVRQKEFGSKHKIGDFWENNKYVLVEWQLNLPVYTIKSWQGEGWTQVVHRNLLMHTAQPHKQDETGPDSGNTPPGDKGLPEPTPSSTGPVTWSQTRAHWLVQCIWEA